jgi:hypothetical protein
MPMPLADILPRQRVNLLAGVRDSGKTRFILPAMLAWADRPPWAYVAADRSGLDAEEVIKDMGYSLGDIPLIRAYGREHKGWAKIVEALLAMSPRPEIAIIEAFQDLAESINKRGLVHEFMNRIDAYLQPTTEFPNGLTILGITGSPKQSMRDRYPDPTQRIPGTSIWGERASAVFVVESAEKNFELTTPNRVLWVCRKIGPRLRLEGEFHGNNRLIFPAL